MRRDFRESQHALAYNIISTLHNAARHMHTTKHSHTARQSQLDTVENAENTSTLILTKCLTRSTDRRRNVFLGTNTLFMDVITESHNTRWQLPDFAWRQNRGDHAHSTHTHTHHTHRNP